MWWLFENAGARGRKRWLANRLLTCYVGAAGVARGHSASCWGSSGRRTDTATTTTGDRGIGSSCHGRRRSRCSAAAAAVVARPGSPGTRSAGSCCCSSRSRSRSCCCALRLRGSFRRGATTRWRDAGGAAGRSRGCAAGWGSIAARSGCILQMLGQQLWH